VGLTCSGQSELKEGERGQEVLGKRIIGARTIGKLSNERQRRLELIAHTDASQGALINRGSVQK